MPYRRFRSGQGPVAAALSIGLLLLVAAPANAADAATVDRFLRLSDNFHARLSGSPLGGLADTQRRARADCILSRFEEHHGAVGVAALMDLMNVLSDGAEFDDPTIIAFNDRFGPDYDRIERECTRLVRGS